MVLTGWREKDLSKINSFKMVDISNKNNVPRIAKAVGRIKLRPDTIKALREGKIQKGDPLAVAEIASIQAVKKTPELIPMCHQIPLTNVELSFNIGEDWLEAECQVSANYKTGVEMEALIGVSVALINVWDMVKYLEKDVDGQYPWTKITDIRVLEKRKNESS